MTVGLDGDAHALDGAVVERLYIDNTCLRRGGPGPAGEGSLLRCVVQLVIVDLVPIPIAHAREQYSRRRRIGARPRHHPYRCATVQWSQPAPGTSVGEATVAGFKFV